MNPITVTPALREEIARRLSHPEPGVQTTVVLSVEDDDATFRLIQLAFRDLEPGLELHRVVDGEDALKFLRQEQPFHDAPRPGIVLMNLNLPKISGQELLAKISLDDSLKELPIIVFSSSNLEADRAKCLALGARLFITKPHTYAELLGALRGVCSFAAI